MFGCLFAGHGFSTEISDDLKKFVIHFPEGSGWSDVVKKTPRKDALPRLIKREGERWVGTLAGLRKVKNLPRLVRAFAGLPDEWQLVILGEGPERDAIRAEAIRLGIVHRVRHQRARAQERDRVV